MMHGMAARSNELQAERVPFVYAMVVRAQAPTSTRPGDDAIILGDGTIEGFVGGQCAGESVRSAALRVLQEGEPMLLRILPDGAEEFPELPGAQVVVNPCLSGGAIEIFLEPHLPAPVLYVSRRDAHRRRGHRPGRATRLRVRLRPDARRATAGGGGRGDHQHPRP